MKVPYDWLAEWVALPWSAAELGTRLTLAGFELESRERAAPAFTGVVVAEIVTLAPHPQADKLRVCQVSTGTGPALQIVCGAPNARLGLRTALAQVGATLPGDLRIKVAKLRGVESRGMLASAKELGLADASSGILELSADAPLGRSLREYLELDEEVLDFNITPNRGDAMSVLGLAREVAALTQTRIRAPAGAFAPGGQGPVLPVTLEAPAACPRFAGCIVRGIDNHAATPLWMRERLRRAGVRSISPVVDVTNYVMLELGQPMHAYDLAMLTGGIRVRMAQSGEALRLLDGKDLRLEPDMLLITDEAGPIGLAGIMGGERSAVQPETRDVFLESAFFSPAAILGRARRLGLLTDASQRFERGVDPSGQARALERALSLLLPITQSSAGPIEVVSADDQLPRRPAVRLRASQLRRLLGVELPAARVGAVLEGLGMQVRSDPQGWQAIPPPHRFDLNIEADLIEEIARLVGFDAIPETDAIAPQRFRTLPAEVPDEAALLAALAQRGYQEAVTLAFVDPRLQTQLFPDTPGLQLANPISSDLAVMRVSLWPGLLRAALENQHRQQDRIRLCEHGTRFAGSGTQALEVQSLAGIACGSRLPEQWGLGPEARVPVDFYDVKADVMALLRTTGDADAFRFEPAVHPALHPGRSARVLRRGAAIGWIGELHPKLVASIDFTYPPVLFELDVAGIPTRVPRYQEVSRFPQVRRDLAVVVDESVTLSSLTERVTLATSNLLRELRVFDVYRGPGLEQGRKSVALGLIFQDISRTLTDDDVERLMASVVADLRENLSARIRE